jgi:hypothetical protein
MLELLSLRKGTTMTKEMFLNHLYGGMDEPELKIIDVFTCKLRKKLANASNGKDYIETVWGRGYCCVIPLRFGQKSQLEPPLFAVQHQRARSRLLVTFARIKAPVSPRRAFHRDVTATPSPVFVLAKLRYALFEYRN